MVDGRSTQIPGSKSGRQLVDSLRAGMKLSMHSLEPLLVDMGINLCGRYIRVAEHLLDDAQVSPIAEQMRGEAVAQ